MLTRQQAKTHLKQMGWSYRSAAPLLGIRYEHLSRVLNGERVSKRLLDAVMSMPPRQAQIPSSSKFKK
jgi:hypothetical protein